MAFEPEDAGEITVGITTGYKVPSKRASWRFAKRSIGLAGLDVARDELCKNPTTRVPGAKR